MPPKSSEYLTTKELAELLRIKERKVYELASSGEIPCSRALGKLLFPRAAIDAWIAQHGPSGQAAPTIDRPGVFLGSHDPLLDWAIRESQCGIATYFDGSLDGIARFADGEGIATGLHLRDAHGDGWNRAAVADRFAREPVVLVEWAWRARGLIVADGNPKAIAGIADLAGLRVVPRQAEAGTQQLFDHLAAEASLKPSDWTEAPIARTEADAALAVLDGTADAALGLESMARQHRLGFVPVLTERFDLLVWRRAWFEPPFQRLLHFVRSDACAAKAKALGGYDQSALGRVHFNGP